MVKKKRLLTVTVGLVCIMALSAIPISGCVAPPITPTAPTAEEATYDWVFGGRWVKGDSKYDAALDLVDRLESASNGRMKINYYGGDLLGDYTVQSQNVTLGLQDMFYDAASTVNHPMWIVDMQTVFMKRNMNFGTMFLQVFSPGKWGYNVRQMVSELCNWKTLGITPEGQSGGVSNVLFDIGPAHKEGIKCRIWPNEAAEKLAEGLGYDWVVIP